MNNLFSQTIFLFVILCLFSRCNKEKCFSPPPSFQLRVENFQGQDLLNPDICISLKLVCYESGNEIVLDANTLFKYDMSSDKKIYYLQSNDLPWKSLEGNKTFMLYRGNLSPDTLIVDVQKKTNNNCTFHSYEGVNYNGNDIKSDFDSSINAYIAKIQ